MALLNNRALDVETADPITTGNAIIRAPDGSQLASVAVDPVTGFAGYKANHQPGIVTWEFESAEQKKIVSGNAYGQSQYVMTAELPEVFQQYGDGIVKGLLVTAPGGMNVTVGVGGLFNMGIYDPVYDPETIAIAAANPSNPRIDRIVSRLNRTGTFAGRIVYAVLQGTPAATPTVPALTQTADINEVEVCRVTVPAGATSIVTGNISITERPAASPATGIADGSITQSKLAKPSVGTPELFDDSVTLAKLDASARQTGQGLVPGLISSYWISAQNVLGGQYPAVSGSVSGGFGGGTATVIPAANFDVSTQVLYACPIYIPKATTITGVAVDVISGGASVVARFGIYNAGTNGLPASLISGGDLGTLTMTASGPQSKTVSPAVSIAAGWYWAAVIFSTTTPIVQGLHSIRDFFGSSGPGDNTAYGFLQGVHSPGTASLPPTYPSPGVSAAGPNIYLRTSGT